MKREQSSLAQCPHIPIAHLCLHTYDPETFVLFHRLQSQSYCLIWWPLEDVADELADKISQFVSSLPKTVRKVEEEPITGHIQKMFDEAKSSDHGHEHYGGHGAGYKDAYGIGGGW